MPQATLPAAVEVFHKLRTQRMQEVRLGVTLSEPTEDSDSALADVQNEGEFPVDFDPANEKYDFFYRSVNENKVGKVVAIKRTVIRTTLSGAINATSFNLVAPSNTDSFKVGDVIEIEDELMVLLTWNTGTGAATVEERGAHGTTAASHIDASAVALMRYTVPHNSVVLSGSLDNVLPLAPTTFVLANVVGAIGNGISMTIGLPTSQIKTLFRVHIQTSTVLWPEDFENLTGLIGTRAAGSDGAIVQGGSSLTTSTVLNTGWAGKFIHTHESINLSTGEVSAPDILRIDSLVDNGDGTWTVNVIGDNVFNLRRGVVGTAGVVNFVIVDDFRKPGNPSTWVEQVKPFFNQGAGDGDPDVIDVNHILWTAETVYARCRLRNFEGYGPWMYHNGSTGTTTRLSATTFTPGHMQEPAFDDGAVTAVKQSKGTIPATVNINMQPDDQDTVSWSSGDVAWADGTTESITAVGSPKTFGPGIIYVFKLTGNSTLQFTSVFSSAVGNDRTYLGQIIVASPPVVGEFATVFLFGDINGPTLTSAVGAFGKLSALTADLGEINAGSLTAVTIIGSTITGGTFQTAGSGERIQITGTTPNTIDWLNSIGVSRVTLSYGSGTNIFNLFHNSATANAGVNFDLAGQVYVFTTTRMIFFGKDIESVDDVECNSLSKFGGGSITINDTLLPNGSINLGSSGQRWNSIFAVSVNFSGGQTFGDSAADQCAFNSTLITNLNPNADNAVSLGISGKRYTTVWSVALNTGDINFANDWMLTEYPLGLNIKREDARDGLAFLDDTGSLMAVLHKDGYLYCKGVKPLEELPQ